MRVGTAFLPIDLTSSLFDKRGIELTVAVFQGKQRPHRAIAKWHRVLYHHVHRRQQVSREGLPASDQTQRVPCASVRLPLLEVAIDVDVAQPLLAFAWRLPRAPVHGAPRWSFGAASEARSASQPPRRCAYSSCSRCRRLAMCFGGIRPPSAVPVPSAATVRYPLHARATSPRLVAAHDELLVLRPRGPWHMRAALLRKNGLRSCPRCGVRPSLALTVAVDVVVVKRRSQTAAVEQCAEVGSYGKARSQLSRARK